MKKDFFISYSHKDAAIADTICSEFDTLGISYFIDRKRISTAAEYMEVIAVNLLECRYVLFLGSENSYKSKYAIKELLYAVNNNRDIVAYILDDSRMPSKIELALSDINLRYLLEMTIPEFCKSLVTLCKKKDGAGIFRKITPDNIKSLISECTAANALVSLDAHDLEFLYHSSEAVYGIIPLANTKERLKVATDEVRKSLPDDLSRYSNVIINIKVAAGDASLVMQEMEEIRKITDLFGDAVHIQWGLVATGVRSELFVILSVD